MKLSWGFVLSSIYLSTSAASPSRVGRVYTYDPPSSQESQQAPTRSTVSPETARLIFAQRLGLSQYHSLGTASDEDIRLLNEYGGRPQQFFGGDRERNNGHAFIWIDGYNDPYDPAAFPTACKRLLIENPPATSDNERLVENIRLQAKSCQNMADPHMKAYTSTLSMEAFLEGGMGSLAKESGSQVHVYNDRLAILHLKQNTVTTRFWNIFDQAIEDGLSATVVLMPSSDSNTKRSTNSYGTYSLPSNKISARREKPESILSSPAAPETSPVSQNISVNNLEDFPTIQATQAPLGILPNCFETLTACQRQTNNCTGHGACYLAMKGDLPEGDTKDCYSCQCKATVVGSGNSKKTTNWGGPACQKKDIVVPFWLFAGTTVILMFLIGSGIGMLYTMGSEELPSVIGAGVSGPVKK